MYWMNDMQREGCKNGSHVVSASINSFLFRMYRVFMSVPVLDYGTYAVVHVLLIILKKHAYHKVCILAQLCGMEELV